MASPLAGRIILVVVVEVLIAADLERALADAGAHVVAATTAAEAIGLLEDWAWAGAVLDYALSDANCDPICEWMIERGIPFVLYTGRAETSEIARMGTVVKKPASSDEVARIMAELVSGNFHLSVEG